MTKTTALLSSLLLSIAACGGTSDDHAHDVQSGLDELVRDEVADNGFLGTGVTVRRADGTTLRSSRGVAHPEQAIAYDVASTEQVIGSVTKLYTAVLLMQLLEEGKLGLDDTIDRWFSFAGADAITVRMLLQHRSGLNDYLNFLSLEQIGQPWTPDALLQVALDAGPLGTPGMEQGIYSNTNFLLLALIVEAETGKPWEDNIQERIARPLGLQHTYFAGESERAENLAGGWIPTEQGWLDSLTMIDPSVGWAVGGLVSTNEELRRFTTALFDGELFESPETLAQMTRFETEMNPAYLGEEPPTKVGLCILQLRSDDGLRLEGHLGHIEGFNAAALRDAETGDIMVVTSNDNRAYSGYTAFKVAAFLRVVW